MGSFDGCSHRNHSAGRRHHPVCAVVVGAVTIIDKLFAIIFARYRRKLGDAKIESAWYRANNRVVGYLLFPIAAILYFIFAIIYFPVVKDSAFDHRRPLILVGAAIYVISAFALGRGFNVFLKNPPRLNSE